MSNFKLKAKNKFIINFENKINETQTMFLIIYIATCLLFNTRLMMESIVVSKHVAK